MTVYIENYDPTIAIHGFNTAKAARFEAGVTFTGAITASSTFGFTGAVTASGGLDASGSAIKYKRTVLASSGNTTMTSAMSGSVMLMDSATVDFTLPAIGAGDVGMEFDFVVTVTSTNQSITAATGDLLVGSMTFMDAATPLFDVFTPDVSDDLIFSTNGTTTGGLVGSCYRFTAISATRWWVSGFNLGSGTAATPFS